MKRLFSGYTVAAGLLVGLVSCENISVLPSHDIAPPTCEAPPLEQNIIGTWHFEVAATSGSMGRQGSVTFDAAKYIVDPDSLFVRAIAGDPVFTKAYNPRVAKLSTVLFEAYLTTKRGTRITTYTIISNECHKIQVSPIDTQDGVAAFTLTR